jgi:hypothetical protein
MWVILLMNFTHFHAAEEDGFGFVCHYCPRRGPYGGQVHSTILQYFATFGESSRILLLELTDPCDLITYFIGYLDERKTEIMFQNFKGMHNANYTWTM